MIYLSKKGYDIDQLDNENLNSLKRNFFVIDLNKLKLF